jgi:hypothetical protein
LFTERRGDVVNPFEFDAALTEQAVCLAAGASSRLLVDRDRFVAHFVSPTLREDAAHARRFGDATDGEKVRADTHVRANEFERVGGASRLIG